MAEFIAYHHLSEPSPSQTFFFDRQGSIRSYLTEMPNRNIALLQSRMKLPKQLGIFDGDYPMDVLPQDFQPAISPDSLQLEQVVVAAGFTGEDRTSLDLRNFSLSSRWSNVEADGLPRITIKHIFEPNCAPGMYQHRIEVAGRCIAPKYKTLVHDGEQVIVPSGTYITINSGNGDVTFFEIGNKKENSHPELDSKISLRVARHRSPFVIEKDQSIDPLMKVVNVNLSYKNEV